MKNLIVVVLLCTTSLAYAGFDEGFDAYKKGNYAAALKEFKKAAEKGEASAQFYLGTMYYNGKGVLQNDAKAVVWYTKAAEQGEASAQFNLGNMYGKGEGVPQDYKIAYILFNIAASKGDDSAVINRDIVLSKLTPAARMEAQRISTLLYNTKNFSAEFRKLLNSQ